MSGILMMAIALVVLGGAYILYGGWLSKKWGIDPNRKTPAEEFNDGVDYEPSDPHVVFGHQFASIAGAGPINGPIQAAIFGWVPVLLWVLIGGVFIGAVQDFSSMFASVRNKGRTIGYIIEQYIGKLGKKLFLAFTWLFSILVVAAFADVVAGTFNGFSGGERIASNGSVATTSMLFILFAVALGLVIKFAKLKKWQGIVMAIAMLIVSIVIGLLAPMYVAQGTWHIIIFLYVLVASVVPVWILLQPRDYLNSYLLVAMIAASVIGVFVANPSINLPAFTNFNVGGQTLFPMLFVTIACGAVSGFHSLVSSGTASKQVRNERHIQPISFGGMLLESLLAVISLIAIASFSSVQAARDLGYLTPPQQFAGGVASFLTKIGLPHDIIFTLINLSVSAFALTSLDSVARVGRIAFQEFFEADEDSKSPIIKFLTDKYVATIATLLVAYLLAKAGYAAIWPLFGSSNQLLSALALIACAVFLKKTDKAYKNMIIPIFFMIAVTFAALIIKIVQLIQAIAARSSASVFGDGLQLVFAILVLGLGVCVAAQGVKTLFARKQSKGITTVAQ